MELRQYYYVSATHIDEYLKNCTYTKLFDNNIHYCVPIRMRAFITDSLLEHVGFVDNIAFSSSESSDNFQRYPMTKSPTTLNCNPAYRKDSNTNIILSKLLDEKEPSWSADTLSKIDPEYCLHLKNQHIKLVYHKLTFIKSSFKDVRRIGLVIVPKWLRCVIFNHFHAGPSSGYMGEYTTLFRICMRFFWPNIRKDIKVWVKDCAHCVAYDVWRNKKSELHFSWPFTTLFYIMCVYLWIPSKLTDKNSHKLQLMNALGNLTQFIVSILVNEATSKILGKLFIEQVVFTFDMVAVVVVDADSEFLHLFEEMCKALGVIFWPLSRGNHKGNDVKRYHRFLNKT